MDNLEIIKGISDIIEEFIENWKSKPYFWGNEIEWGGDFQKEHRKFDRKKLEVLLKQKADGAKYACIIDLKRTKKKIVSKVLFGNDQSKFREYKAKVPIPFKGAGSLPND